MKGTIRSFNRAEGYGSVLSEDGTEYRVFDRSFSKDVDSSWVDGQPVDFELVNVRGEVVAVEVEAGSAPLELLFLDDVSDERIATFASLLGELVGVEFLVGRVSSPVELEAVEYADIWKRSSV